MQGDQQLSLFTAAFLASNNPSAWLVTKKDKTTIDTFGLSFRGWSESLDRVGSLLRTYLELSTLQLTMFAPIWSVKATRSGYGILKLRLSERRTGGQGYSLWRTPDTGCARGAQSPERFAESMAKGRLLTLNDQVAHLFPTPRASDAEKGTRTLEGAINEHARGHGIDLPSHVQLFPTPTANDAKNNNSPSQQTRKTAPLDVVAGGALNPLWVEWLMGFPLGWTDIGE